MPSLLDIAPPELSAETVEIRGTKLSVGGIAADGWAALYSRFPVLRALVTGRTADLPLEELIRGQAALIAAGLGSAGDPEIEGAVMDLLTVDDQRQIVETVVRLSMPGHYLRPLLDGQAVADGDGPGKAAATK